MGLQLPHRSNTVFRNTRIAFTDFEYFQFLEPFQAWSIIIKSSLSSEQQSPSARVDPISVHTGAPDTSTQQGQTLDDDTLEKIMVHTENYDNYTQR